MSENHSEHDEVIESHESKKKWYQYRDFWIGFIGWFAVNYVYFALQAERNLPLFIPFFANIIGIIVLLFTRRRIAMGALGCFAIALVLTLIAGGCHICDVLFRRIHIGAFHGRPETERRPPRDPLGIHAQHMPGLQAAY